MYKLFLGLALILSPFLQAEPIHAKVSAKSAILINADTGAILYEKNAHALAYPGSITKIATCLYAVEQKTDGYDELVSCPLSCLKKITKSAKVANNYKDPPYLLEPDGTHFWIKKGEKLPFIDLLYGLMLFSGNDAANVIANHVCGDIPTFVGRMNNFLKKIGCKNTSFCNPHGLHHPNHKTTAYDVAIITKEAIKYPIICKILSTDEYIRPETNLQKTKLVCSRNVIIQPGKFYYPKALGCKTGYTSDVGYTFMGIARDSERTLIVVLLGCSSSNERCRDAIHLFDIAFSEKKEERLLFKKEENIFSRKIKQGKQQVRARLMEDLKISYFPSEEPDIKVELNWGKLDLPIKEGAALGELLIYDETHTILAKAPLVATDNVEKRGIDAFIDFLQERFLLHRSCENKTPAI